MLPSESEDSHRCAYESDGLRCRYHGTMSHSTLGEGPWFCRWHWQCESTIMGEQVLQESQNYKPLDVHGYRHPDAERARLAYLAKPMPAVNQAREPGEDSDA